MAGKGDKKEPRVKTTTIQAPSELVIKTGEFGSISLGKVGEGQPIPIADPRLINVALIIYFIYMNTGDFQKDFDALTRYCHKNLKRILLDFSIFFLLEHSL